MSFYRDSVRTAKKEHKCDLYESVIIIGEKYHNKAGFDQCYSDEVWSSKECLECQPVITEFLDSNHSDEGYCGEFMNEWWRDEKCYDCQHRFLPCKPDNDCVDLIDEDGHCEDYTPYGTCKAGDTCDDMTHYCRCEKFVKAD